MARFEPFCDRAGAWRYRLVGANGETMMTSGESFASRSNALRAARRVRQVAPSAVIADDDVIAAGKAFVEQQLEQQARRRRVIAGLVRLTA